MHVRQAVETSKIATTALFAISVTGQTLTEALCTHAHVTI